MASMLGCAVTNLVKWLREQTEDWKPSIVGVFRERAPHEWPITASSAQDLRRELTEMGHLLPLPSEPAALANVMEIELREHLSHSLESIADAEVSEGTERSFPDLEFSGVLFGDGIRAVDIKCARRKISKAGNVTGSLNNRIALYTGNTYFLWPTLKFSGILRPFGEYEELLSIVVIYTFAPERPERITDVEVVVHETWRIASRSRASATREYIGSVSKIEDLDAGNGEFGSAEEFYEYWRDSRRSWKKSPEAERLLRRAIDLQG
jgi:hypothetical protein